MWMKVSERKPMLTGELFNRLYGHLQEQNKIPAILDYSLAVRDKECVPVISDGFDIYFDLQYGSSEGIYLDIFAVGEVTEKGENKRYRLGTFKTLLSDDEAMRTMAILGADFICEGKRYIYRHSDAYTFNGYKVQFFRKGEDSTTGYVQTANKDSCIRLIKSRLEMAKQQNNPIAKVVIFDYVTGRERVVTHEEFTCDMECFFRTRKDYASLLERGDVRMVTLTDGRELRGTIDRIDSTYFVIDDESAFGDMVIVSYDEVAAIS